MCGMVIFYDRSGLGMWFWGIYSPNQMTCRLSILKRFRSREEGLINRKDSRTSLDDITAVLWVLFGSDM